MKILDKEIVSKGFIYRQIRRDGDFAIYSQAHKNNPDKILAYEVIIIQKHNGYLLAGTQYPAAEFYPGINQWGRAGWTISGWNEENLKKAIDKMRQVMNNESMKVDKRAIRELSEQKYKNPEKVLEILKTGLKQKGRPRKINR